MFEAITKTHSKVLRIDQLLQILFLSSKISHDCALKNSQGFLNRNLTMHEVQVDHQYRFSFEECLRNSLSSN